VDGPVVADGGQQLRDRLLREGSQTGASRKKPVTLMRIVLKSCTNSSECTSR